ncbi:hypothetical protein KUCAC02_007092, partial [Chaenocephalus aceratus]
TTPPAPPSPSPRPTKTPGLGTPRTVDRAVIGGGRGRGGVRHALSTHRAGTLLCKKGTYFTHEGKGADDAADADTAIINAEGGHTNSDEKKEYYI